MAWQLIPAGLLLVGGVFLHESPLWLMRNGRSDEAFKVLEELRGVSVNHQCILPLVHPFLGIYVIQVLTQG